MPSNGSGMDSGLRSGSLRKGLRQRSFFEDEYGTGGREVSMSK